MCTGLDNLDHSKINNIKQKKTTVVDRVLKRLQADIIVIQEIRFPDCGLIKERTTCFFGRAKSPINLDYTI
uniref:Endonuclease/exonuclease/phosphatase domain-containing protein n=1 Tax=Arion vulgaris TaxID=1028688 RepID=A0A0B7AEZ0_9EUPU